MLSLSVIIPDISNIINKDFIPLKKTNIEAFENFENDDSIWLSSIYEIWETKDIFHDINMRINMRINNNNISKTNNIRNIREGIRILRERKSLGLGDKGDNMCNMVCDHFEIILDSQERMIFYDFNKIYEIHENLSEKITQLQINIEILQLDAESGLITYEDVMKKVELIDIEKKLIMNEINLLKNMGASEYHITILMKFMKGVYRELSNLLKIFHK